MARKHSQPKQQPKKEEALPMPAIVLTHDEIAARAHAIWLQEGRVFGHQAAHWFRAENELRQERELRKTN